MRNKEKVNEWKETDLMELVKMDDYELFQNIDKVIPFHRIERGYFISYMIHDRNMSREDAEDIYDISRNLWMKTDTALSISAIAEYIIHKVISSEGEIKRFEQENRYDIMEAIEEKYGLSENYEEEME